MTDSTDPTPALTAHDGELWMDGAPYRLLSGSIHYFRVHPDQWEDRLRRLAAMGANTVDTYVAWNFHEREEGHVDFTGWRDLEKFVRLAGEIGLDVLLRPSPYICAEWTNGALPSWLTGRVDAVRTSDPGFLAAVDRWYDELIPRMVPLQKAHGGPIIAMQVENEYGSFGSDRAYLEHLRDGLRARCRRDAHHRRRHPGRHAAARIGGRRRGHVHVRQWRRPCGRSRRARRSARVR